MSTGPYHEEHVPLLGEAGDIQVVKDSIRFPSCRAILAFTCFLGFVNVYALRVNLSVALVAMVNDTSPQPSVNASNDCPGVITPNTSDHTSTGEFNWDSELQGYILGAFFYGYIFTQLPGGRLAEMFGGKYLYGLGVLCTAVLTLLTPLAARTSPYLFIAVRILEGIGEGVTFPAMHAILAKWAPPTERSKLGTFIYAGSQMGTVISLPLSGLISDRIGWEYVFYIFGCIGCLWFVAFVFLVYDSPAKHPRISVVERKYIEDAIGTQPSKPPPVPWCSIFTSIHFWALAVAHFSYNWGFYTLLTTLPKYMSEVLHFDLSENGLISALPYAVMWLTIVVTGQIVDRIIERGILSTTVVRKLCNTFGLLIPAVTLITVSFLGCDRNSAVIVLVIGGGLAGISQSGYNINHLDLAPPYAGTMMGMTNSLATIPGFLGPQVVGWLTQSDQSAKQWQKVFFIAASIYAFGALVFAIFASGRKQPWAEPKQEHAQGSDKHDASYDGS